MSSKVYKSEKPKLKFAQSNINHVYRGNTTETQYKPTVRQYGMQVVGKLQGTRRLPPPAWVPSIKAESGGLDSRVALVPPGGSGWGAPATSESAPTQASSSTTTEVGSPAVTTALSSMNGTLMRDALGTSFEPAYARSHFGPATSTTVASAVEPTITKSLNAWTALTEEGKVVTEHRDTEMISTPGTGTGEETTTTLPPWAPRTQATGGLAANKPFFQRPTPVASSSVNATSSTKSTERPSVSGASGVTSDIVGESGGWAGINEEEPNFDEQIIFSDEEGPDEIRVKSAVTEEQTRVGGSVSPATPARVSPPKSLQTNTTHASQLVLPKQEPLGGHTSVFAPVSSNMYDSTSRVSSDVWSAPNVTAGLPIPSSHSLIQLPNAAPYSAGQLISGVNTSSDERVLFGSHQYMQHHAVPTVHTLPSVFPDPYLSSRPNTMVDPILPTGDVDSELHAQRQARTQEFKSAVERAQQARAARQAIDNYNTEGDSLIQRSVVNLISDSTDGHTSAALTTSSNILLPQSLHGVQPLLGSVLSSQLLSPYQQGAAPNRSDLAAAMAAATAVAMACNGAGVTTSLRSSGSTILKSVPIHQTPHSTINSTIAASWHNPFSTPSTTAQSSGIYTVRQSTLPQVIQSTLAMTSGGPQGSHQNPMYLDPDFVERVLEILNHQQVSLPTADQHPPSNLTTSPLDAGISSTTTENISIDKPTSQSELTPREAVRKSSEANTGELDSSSLKVNSRSDTQIAGHLPAHQTAAQFAPSGEKSNPEKAVSKAEGKRIPGLMDVKVSSSRNFNLSWDEDDHLSSSMGARGRVKPFVPDRSRGAGRGRRPVGRFPNDDSKINRTRSSGPVEDHEGRSHGLHYGAYPDRHHGSRQRNWQPSKLHSSQGLSSGTKSEHNPTGVCLDAEPGSNLLVDAELGRNVPSQMDFPQDAEVDDESDEMEEPTELVETHDARGKGTATRHSDNATHTESNAPNSKQRRGSLEPADTGTFADRQDHPRRAERGRRGRGASSSYYPSSRTFSNEDAVVYSGHHMEPKPYSRASRGITFTRGHRALVNSATASDSRGRRALEEPRNRGPDRDFRGTYSYGSGYPSMRTARGSVYYDSEGCEQVNSFDPCSRSNAAAQDARRHQSYKSRPSTGTSHFTNDVRRDDHFSDGEQGGGGRKHARILRNRSHEGPRHTFKSSAQRFATERERQKHESEDNATVEDRPEMTSLDMPILTDYGDNDIPTVRVPAADMGFNPRPQYTYPRVGRSGTFPRGSGSRRNPNRVTTLQQNKRAPGSNVSGSRRYRDQRDRYHDGKDGDGGAAAGGTGRSTMGGDSTGGSGQSDGSRRNGCENVGGNQNSGGNREAGASDGSLLGQNLEETEKTVGESESQSVNFSSTDHTNHNYVERSGDARIVQNRHPEFVSRGLLSDVNDIDEWETATEGSTDPESASSTLPTPNPTVASVTYNISELSAVVESHPLVSVEPDASQPVFGLSTNSSNEATVVGDGMHAVPPDASIPVVSGDNDEVTSIPSITHPASQTTGELSGCQLPGPDRYPHDRRGNGDGSGGTTGGTDTHGSRGRGYQAGSRSGRTYISVSGGRSSAGQRFQKSSTSRYHQADYSNRRTSVPSIPPLMSLKPHGPFTHTSQTPESKVNMNPKPQLSEDPSIKTTTEKVEGGFHCGPNKAQTSPDPNEYDSDQDSILSDGFTKVISKASKKLARRRLKQEFSASAKPSIRRDNDSSKPSQTVQPNDKGREHSLSQTTTRLRYSASGQNKPLQKTKPLLVKPTFMGPPLSSVSMNSTGETAVSRSKATNTNENTTVSHTTKAWVTAAPTQFTTGTSDCTQAKMSTARPWSKVVGTKSSSASSAVVKSESRTISSVSSFERAVDADWSTDLKHTDSTSAQPEDGDSINALLPQSKDLQLVMVETTETVDAETYTSARQFWSPTKEQNDEKSTAKAVVAVHPSNTCTPVAVSSTGIVSSTLTGSTVSVSVSTVSNNICKVRPQQQQPVVQSSPGNSGMLTANPPLPTVAPVSPNSTTNEHLPAGPNCASETSTDPERTECDYEESANQPHAVRRLPTEGAFLVVPHPPNRPISSSWTDNVTSQLQANYYPNRPGALPLASSMDSSFSANIWPTSDQALDSYGNRLAGVGGSAVNQAFSQVHGSDVLSNLLTGPNAPSLCVDPSNKSQQSIALVPRSHSYSVQPYGPSVVSSSELHNYGGLYSGEANKLSSSHSVPQSQAAAFASAAGSVFVPPQQQQSAGHQAQSAHSFPTNWTLPSSQQRYRQRFPQVEPSAFGGFTYQTELQNEYAYLPSATGCVQPAAAGGIFSAVQAQPQPSYHPHNTARHNMGPPAASNPWSILANPTGASGLQASAQDYGSTFAPSGGGNASGGGLLPHPVPPGGYNATHGPVQLPISTSPNSSFVAHHNYVGVIGGGRPNATDLSNVSTRQRGVVQSIFPSHNISHSPSAQSQPQFPVHSAFYPSLSPSHHQRLQQLQQFTGSQGRPNVHSLMNPATGLYATAFGTAQQPNQPTPPPLPSQLGYASFTSESAATVPISFYSTSQSQSTVGLQHHIHSQRQAQSSVPHMASRNVGAAANHGGSPLLIPSAVGPSAFSGYGQPTPSAALSGYPIKHVLPTL
ncbi:BAT2 protein [Opisthorchis viverrini]|uniref:Uncharacterized protein n=2 Tax=Opisthorchis viverrini TaxID=6198 RepID=A0A075AJD1_OPIVI|nr:hypothetical protein T265_00873 [Opisthorchis viverrini]KER33174.1 hypothetical protein T265_00873 [Opisthorchis viverrini]OON19603.1 BAT2 protein [Opisthorchis viverrini]